jgi:ubiquinone/menaquinone biosynthesis C-methylase UbiE
VSWLLAAIYDRHMAACERAGLSSWRAQLLGRATGRVLEIGAGTGVNLEHYPTHVEQLVLLEPDRHMRKKLAARVAEIEAENRSAGRLTILDGVAEDIAVPDASFDTVVSTLVLCSVSDLDRALTEIYRVLVPGGRLLFLEHVLAAAHTSRRAWQRRLEPVWKHLAGNCHLTRDTAAAIEDAGFMLEHVERESMRKALPIVRPTVRGTAVKPGV